MTLYTPDVLELVLAQVEQRLPARAAALFRTCFLDTLDQTITIDARGDAFVVTGDIPAMWLRDSTTQLGPYLHFLRQDSRLADTVAAVVRRQFSLILVDPYANAFNDGETGAGHQDDLTDQSPAVWERKFELDSLCYPVQLAHDLWALTGRTDHLGDLRRVAHAILQVLEIEQHHETRSTYRFQRPDAPAGDSLVRGGRGREVAPTGLVWAGFRPSDDACELGYNIPGNIFVALELGHLAELLRDVLDETELADRADALRVQIEAAIERHATTRVPAARGDVESDEVYAFEVDGHGAALVMDDANMPSLLSLPLFGWCPPDDPLYLRTRAAVLSPSNPYYAVGAFGQGIGSPHTPPGMVWPIALAVQGLTAVEPDESRRMLDMIVATDGGTGMVHESFDPDDPDVFTREWFSWANAMYCELALHVAGLRTHVRAPRVVGQAR